MACPTVTTGSAFLARALSHLDCQAQTLGSFGFQSLAAPGSPASIVLTTVLTLFIALYGVRLLFQFGGGRGDLANAALKIGIVLTIAASWPAWRIVAHDIVLHGPAEIAASITPSTLPSPRRDFAERLQTIDTGIAVLTAAGTGRQTGEIIGRGQAGSGFRPIALEDEAGFGWSRALYLASTIGSLATLRIAGGLLLALAPLMAGLLLFDFSRGLFAGWVRGLVLVALGSLGLTVLLSVQVAVMEPWLADVLSRRNLGYATPTAPTELLALVGAFAIAAAGLLFLLAKVAFQNGWSTLRPLLDRPSAPPAERMVHIETQRAAAGMLVAPRALAISQSIAGTIRREEARADGMDRARSIALPSSNGLATAVHAPITPAPLGSGYRRNMRRDTSSRQRRDGRG